MKTLPQPVLICVLLAGCAAENVRSDYDPLEGVNRKIFWLNVRADRYVLEPIAKGYDYVVPDPVQGAIAKFFANVYFPINFVNNLLQGKPVAAGGELGRFLVNSTVGIGGLFDPAAIWGLDAHVEDFGQTLGTWGVRPGPYLVLPFFGPSNPRDTVGLVADYPTQIYPFFVSNYASLAIAAPRVVNYRSRNLETVEAARAAALDFYVFVRDAYFQTRQKAIRDENQEESPADDDLYNDDFYDEDISDD